MYESWQGFWQGFSRFGGMLVIGKPTRKGRKGAYFGRVFQGNSDIIVTGHLVHEPVKSAMIAGLICEIIVM